MPLLRPLFAFLAVLGVAAAPSGGAGAKPLIGVSLIEHDQAAAEVYRVRPGFPAARAGLEEGDLILDVDGVELKSAEDVAAAISKAIEWSEDGKTEGVAKSLHVRRGDETFYLVIRPWITPNAALDAELFPYPSPSVSESGTALKARIADRDYDIVSAQAVFTLLRSIGVDNSFQGRRVAFRARVLNCDQLAGGPTELAQPGSSPLYTFTPAQSLLFDPKAAEVERLKCETYFDQNNLDLSSPIVVIAGRLTTDEKAVMSQGGPILLVDAVLFDNSHVTLGDQVMGLVQFVDQMVRMVE